MLIFVSLLAVTKKKYMFFRFPFLEPERQQLSPLLTVTPLLCGRFKRPHRGNVGECWFFIWRYRKKGYS